MRYSLKNKKRKIEQLIEQNRIAVSNIGGGVFYFLIKTYYGRKIKIKYYRRMHLFKCECSHASYCLNNECIYTEACKEYLKRKENGIERKDKGKNH